MLHTQPYSGLELSREKPQAGFGLMDQQPKLVGELISTSFNHIGTFNYYLAVDLNGFKSTFLWIQFNFLTIIQNFNFLCCIQED